jgi:hypothetical protein
LAASGSLEAASAAVPTTGGVPGARRSEEDDEAPSPAAERDVEVTCSVL